MDCELESELIDESIDIQDLVQECDTIPSDESDEEDEYHRRDMYMLQQKSYKLLVSLL